MHSSLATISIFVTLVREFLTQPPPVDPNQINLIVPQSVDDCYKAYMQTQLSEQAAQVACLQELLWGFQPAVNFSVSDSSYFKDLFGSDFVTMVQDALPPTGYRVRREARTMSSGEWQRFKDALDTLYKSGTIRRFAELHAQAVENHYGGPSFLPWNRLFLLMFEEALRQVDRHTFLPYWDTSMDDGMSNPVDSIIWEPEYFGTKTGDVKTGLGADWVTDQGYLQRNYGREGRLISKDNVRELTRQCNLEKISRPTATPEHDLELIQGGPQVWVGGDMAHPATAGFDPLFYMQRAHVDYLWELVRVRQFNNCSVNPTEDYPDVPPESTHHGDANMFGFDWLTNRDGIQGNWIESWYSYEIHPTCPDCCPSCIAPDPIYCDKPSNVCVSRSRRSFPMSVRDTTIPTKEQFLEPDELLALSSVLPPRNRGPKFDHPPSDGRTLSTAIYDTVGKKLSPVASNAAPSRLAQQSNPAFATQGRSRSSGRSPSFTQQTSSLRPNRAGSPPMDRRVSSHVDRFQTMANPRRTSNRFATQRTARPSRGRQSGTFQAARGDNPGFTRQDVRRISSRSQGGFVNRLHASGGGRQTRFSSDRRTIRRPDMSRMAVAPNGMVFQIPESRSDRQMQRTGTTRLRDTSRSAQRHTDRNLRGAVRPDGLQMARQNERTRSIRPRPRAILPRSWDVREGINNMRSFSSETRSDARRRPNMRTQQRRGPVSRQQDGSMQRPEPRSFRQMPPRTRSAELLQRQATRDFDRGLASRDFTSSPDPRDFTQRSSLRHFDRDSASRRFVPIDLRSGSASTSFMQDSRQGNFFPSQGQGPGGFGQSHSLGDQRILGSRGFTPMSVTGSFVSGNPSSTSFVHRPHISPIGSRDFVPQQATGSIPSGVDIPNFVPRGSPVGFIPTNLDRRGIVRGPVGSGSGSMVPMPRIAQVPYSPNPGQPGVPPVVSVNDL